MFPGGGLLTPYRVLYRKTVVRAKEALVGTFKKHLCERLGGNALKTLVGTLKKHWCERVGGNA